MLQYAGISVGIGKADRVLMSEDGQTQAKHAPVSGHRLAEPDRESMREELLVTSSTIIAVLGLIWGLMYLFFGELYAAAIPSLYAFISFSFIAYYAVTGRYRLLRFSQLLITLLFPFFLMVALGGFVNSSAVVLWSFTSPVGALLFARPRQAIAWFGGFVVLVAVGVVLDAYFLSSSSLSPAIVNLFFAMNLVGVAVVVFVLMAYFVRQRDRAQEQLLVEQNKSDTLLLNILPAAIAGRLKGGEQTIAECFDMASILFADIVGFTPLSAELGVERVVKLLNDLLSQFDAIVERYELEKIRTMGDGYMIVSGIPMPRDDHAHALAAAALELRSCTARFCESTGLPLHIRIGINSGTIMAGVIGRHRFSYDVWGDPVNVASRMESQGLPDKIQVSERTYNLIKDEYECEPRGEIFVKGKGRMVTWFLIGRKERGPQPAGELGGVPVAT